MLERVRGILINKGSIILIKRTFPNKIYYTIPGGGIEAGESHEIGLKREMKEELGIDVTVGDLLYSYIFQKDGKAKGEMNEFFYFCTALGGKIGTGDGPEFQENSGYDGAHEIVTVPVIDLQQINLLPIIVKNMICPSLN